MSKIKILALEGLDGSGKSTQIDLLRAFFSKNKIKFKYLHFPVTDSEPYGELVARFLRGEFGDVGSVHPQLVALLFALNRSEFYGVLTGAEFENGVILLDRYVYSNIAFQCSKLLTVEGKIRLQNWILNFEFDFLKLPKPDLCLFLDVPSDFMKQNLSLVRMGESRSYLNGQRDIHEASVNLQESVAREYSRLVQDVDGIKRIECYNANGILSREEIHAKIVDTIGMALLR